MRRFNPDCGILEGRSSEKLILRISALRPLSSEFTSEQLNLIAEIAERYGSGQVHVTPRQAVEVPDVPVGSIEEIKDLLNSNGLKLGSTGRQMRNIIACSRWCLYNARPVSDLARQLNEKYSDTVLPGKTIISLSGCDFSCVRSRTSDIGVIARSEVVITDKECKHCKLCIKDPLGCQVDAIVLTEDSVHIDRDRCVRCGFCWNVCRPGTINSEKYYFDLYLGGRGGLRPKEAVFFKRVDTEEELIEEIDRVLKTYTSRALEGQRISDLVETMGLEVFN